MDLDVDVDGRQVAEDAQTIQAEVRQAADEAAAPPDGHGSVAGDGGGREVHLASFGRSVTIRAPEPLQEIVATALWVWQATDDPRGAAAVAGANPVVAEQSDGWVPDEFGFRQKPGVGY